MAWNKFETKDLQEGAQVKSALGLGAPVALNPSMAGRAYRDSWDIERAYREGMQRVTWVFRCIDAIAGNQARLPAILRKDNSPRGEIVDRSHEVLDLLNTKTNEGENSFIFRFRMSSQLLMSTRGVFIEKVRGRNGKLIALHLLPPQHTAPIPDPKKFVSGFEVNLPNGGKKIIRTDDVVWIRRPHPLDPYLSLTPMETAGIAIEIENLAKLYNRNFLYNDGRPGGLLVVRGEMDEDDKEELRSRFRGNLNRTGATSVIAADDGVDFVDTSSNPRDASYIQMRQITKEEILAAFGVPESVIGNASGRTFSNAAEEGRVFWNETMQPHLEVLARGLDELDDQLYVDFDTSDVPILIIAKQERHRYLMDEFGNGLISGNEYREGTGRETVESELMDSMLANPNLTPIGNTEKPFNPQEQQPVDMAGAAPPQEGEAPTPPTEPEGDAEEVQVPAEPTPEQEAALKAPMEFKSFEDKDEPDLWDVKSEQSVDRWTEIMDRSLERLFERQQRVVMEKAGGAKARRALAAGELSVDSIFDAETWNRQLQEDLSPVVAAIVGDAAEIAVETSSKNDSTADAEPLEDSAVKDYVAEQVERMQKANNSTREEILAAVLVALALNPDEDRGGVLRTALGAVFAELLGRRRRAMAEHETQTAFNAGTYLAAQRASAGRSVQKRWLSRRDGKVRTAHQRLHGTAVPLAESFTVGGAKLRFPGDPSAPPSLTMNCRCRLRFS
jgi:HK97 family phage portal protein